MPNNLDFSQFKNVKTIEVNPENWVSPLYVEYGVSEENHVYDEMPYYYWRVKGTQHTFKILITRMDFLSSGDYKKHFENALEDFRENYMEWKSTGFICEWARDYRDQFARYIII